MSDLLYASMKGHLEIVKVLLAAGAEINNTDNIGKTPLHEVSRCGRLEIVKVLLAAGAEIDNTNNYGYTPLHYASNLGHLEIVKIEETRNYDGRSPTRIG